MAGWRWHLLNSKEAVVIILWYATYALCYSTFQSFVMSNKTAILVVLILTSTFYSVFGLIGEVFIGQNRLIRFSLWVQWITMIAISLNSSLMLTYEFPKWLKSLLVAVPFTAQLFGLSMFQITAVQFGIDQLQGASSEKLSTFIFWYFSIELLPRTVLQWVLYLFSNLVRVINIAHFQLGCCLLSTLLLTVILCIRSCSISKCFSGELEKTTSYRCRTGCDKANPYSLVYRVLKFALEHKHPIRRSALTYWEDKLPSRIDLGKSKYGGPFTAEEVENVKTFFQLIKTLLSLSGIFIVSFLINLEIDDSIFPQKSHLLLINAICGSTTVGTFILLHAVFFLSRFRKHLPSMLKRIWMGAILTVACALSILLIESIGTLYATYPQYLPCSLSIYTFQSMNLSPYLFLIPCVLSKGVYIVFTASLFEFIIAQSPQSMKGTLIGLYYTIRFGLAGLFSIVEDQAFSKYPPTGRGALNCVTAYYLEVTLLALPSLIIFTIVAWKYKLRERDEVVNVHIFAEEYYSK